MTEIWYTSTKKRIVGEEKRRWAEGVEWLREWA
jgi:hypothetical protein